MADLSDLFRDEEDRKAAEHEAWLRDPEAQAKWRAQLAKNAERAAAELARAGPQVETVDCPQCDGGGGGHVDDDDFCDLCDGTGQVPAMPEGDQ